MSEAPRTAMSSGFRPGLPVQFVTLLRREYWQHRRETRSFGLWVLFVLIICVLFLVTTRLEYLDADQATVAIAAGNLTEILLPAMALLIDMTLLFLMAMLAVNSLVDERKDGSILFWRSLPVSDELSLSAKLLFIVLVAPFMAFVAILLVQLLLVVTASLLFSQPLDAFAGLWRQADMTAMSQRLAAMFLGQSLWYLPSLAWLMLCAAWGGRFSPFLPALLLPLGIMVVETLLKLPTDMTRILLERTPLRSPVGLNLDALEALDKNAQVSLLPLLDTDFGALVTSAEFWLGLLVAAALVLAAARVRRWRGDAR